MIVAVLERGKLTKEPETEAERQRMARNFAEMVATRQPPGTGGTDRVFQAGRSLNHNLVDMPEWMRRRIVEKARKAGLCVGGRIYMPSLADKRGPADPRAWINDRSELLESCHYKKKPTGFVDGYVAEGPPPVEEPDIPLAEDIVQANMQEYLMRDPGRARNLPELREEIIEKHGAPAAKASRERIKRERKAAE